MIRSRFRFCSMSAEILRELMSKMDAAIGALAPNALHARDHVFDLCD